MSAQLPDKANADALRRTLGAGVLTLDAEDIQGLLPHEPSMIMLDRVITFVPQRQGVGIKAVTGNEYGLSRRDHGFVFPATLGVEALAQLAAVVWFYPKDGVIPRSGKPRLRSDGGVAGTLGQVRGVDVRSELLNPDRLNLEVSLTETKKEGDRGDLEAYFRGHVSVHGTVMVEASFSLLL